jgi:hypothetical protein
VRFEDFADLSESKSHTEKNEDENDLQDLLEL